MNTHTPRAQQHRQVQSLAVLAMFTAILFLLTFTPIGMIDLPIIKATVLHVPVIIGALLLGPKKGAFLGGMFGLASLLKNTLVPNLSSFAFSPLIPVPGLDRGSPWALVVCFVPRILVGVTPWLVYTLLQALSRRRGSVLQAGSMALSAVVGAFTNTALVMGLIALLFRDAYAAARRRRPSPAALSGCWGGISTPACPPETMTPPTWAWTGWWTAWPPWPGGGPLWRSLTWAPPPPCRWWIGRAYSGAA